mmetsp:Transcript_24781/g.32375  ORF Transcript_24781/g.32375 Transcript_24781/m.32375 type:complete len:105 (-) Transcript_24781:467-781(-)
MASLHSMAVTPAGDGRNESKTPGRFETKVTTTEAIVAKSIQDSEQHGFNNQNTDIWGCTVVLYNDVHAPEVMSDDFIQMDIEAPDCSSDEEIAIIKHYLPKIEQ